MVRVERETEDIESLLEDIEVLHEEMQELEVNRLLAVYLFMLWKHIFTPEEVTPARDCLR